MSINLAAFLPELLSGLLINLSVAAMAVAIGVGCGIPLALIRLQLRWTEWPIRMLIRVMQAAPVYVVMFFLLNLLPSEISLGPVSIGLTALTALTLAQSVYMVSYVEENGLTALTHLRRREHAQAILFLPNVMRGFIVVVMSSGLGAAIGVSEAVGVTLHHAQRLPELGDRVLLFLFVIACFVTVFGTANALLRRLIRSIGSGPVRAPQAEVRPSET